MGTVWVLTKVLRVAAVLADEIERVDGMENIEACRGDPGDKEL